jgi:hypothetical protein
VPVGLQQGGRRLVAKATPQGHRIYQVCEDQRDQTGVVLASEFLDASTVGRCIKHVHGLERAYHEISTVERLKNRFVRPSTADLGRSHRQLLALLFSKFARRTLPCYRKGDGSFLRLKGICTGQKVL